MGDKRPSRYNWVKSPVQRQLQGGLVMLDDDVLGTLKRFELLVWKNPAGVEGNGFMYLDTGQKTPKDQVIRMLARMNPAARSEVNKHLKLLKEVDEVAFDTKGRPFLKHWKRDKENAPTNTAEVKTRIRDRDLVPEAIKLLPWFIRAGEPRTVDALCEWLGGKMKKCPRRTMPRVVALLVEDGVVLVEGGVVSISSSVLPSQASPAPAPPLAEELETEVPNMSETCPTDIDIDSIAKEFSNENPIEAIDEAPDNNVAAAPSLPDSTSTEEGGAGAGEADCRRASFSVSPPIPVGHADSGQSVREGGRARAVMPSVPADRPRVSRTYRDMGFSRKLSGGHYQGWVKGTFPHPRCSVDQMLEFKRFDLADCDLIDAMMFLAPDGTPPGDKVFPKGQEAAFKSVLGKINKAAGGMAPGDHMIRNRVIPDYIDMQQRRRKEFGQDVAVLMGLLNELLAELRVPAG